MENQTKRKYKKHKQGYTVTVTHFLRENKRFIDKVSTAFNKDHISRYPLYIRVLFQQQNVKMRSRLSVDLTDYEFDDYMKNSGVRQFLEIETAAIKFSVEKFNPQQIPDFKIGLWSSFYEKGDVSIFEYAQEIVMDKYKDIIFRKLGLTNEKLPEELAFIHDSVNISLLHLSYFAKLNIKPAAELYEEYKQLLELPALEEKFFSDRDIDGRLSLWDWKSGTYKQLMVKEYGESVLPILKLLEDLSIDTYIDKKIYQ